MIITIRFAALLLMASTLALPSSAAAAETGTLLTISGDRIGYLEAPVSQPAAETIARYYAQLSDALQQRLAGHQATLATLLREYEFALNAGDTAEMNSFLSKATVEWVGILQVHSDEFTDPARTHLRRLYGQVYPWLASR